MLTASFYWSLSGIFLSLFSTLFLLNDVKHHRTYMIVGGGSFFERKATIRRDRSPLLFKTIVVGTVLCTALTVVICSVVLLVSVMTSMDPIKEMDSWKVVAVFIPYGLVMMYVLEGTSIRVFAKSWNIEVDAPQTLGLRSDDKRDKDND